VREDGCGCVSYVIRLSLSIMASNISLGYTLCSGDTRWRSWLRHCATSRKFAGSIPEGIIWNFHWHTPSCRNIALETTQLLKEMSTRNISCGVKVAGAQGWKPNHLHEPNVLKNLGASTSWKDEGLSSPVMGLFYPLLRIYHLVYYFCGFSINTEPLLQYPHGSFLC
jgi:hypothetical protein